MVVMLPLRFSGFKAQGSLRSSDDVNARSQLARVLAGSMNGAGWHCTSTTVLLIADILIWTVLA